MVIYWGNWMRLLFGFDEREQIDQYPQGRDGHAPFLRDAKSNIKETLE